MGFRYEGWRERHEATERMTDAIKEARSLLPGLGAVSVVPSGVAEVWAMHMNMPDGQRYVLGVPGEAVQTYAECVQAR